jgi:anti-anti-sigma factor
MELFKTELVEAEPPVLLVVGEVDFWTADDLRTALVAALSAHPDVVVDMAGVTFIDAAGVRAVLSVAAALNGAGPLTLRNASRVARIVELVQLDDLTSVVFVPHGDGDGG